MADELSALEARSDVAPKPAADPEMTMEQKAQVLLHQRTQLSTQLTIHRLQQQLEQMPSVLNVLLNKICKELDIDANEFTFDLDNLRIIRKPKA